MNIIKKIAFGLAVLAAVIVGVGWLLPATAHVERAIVIEAPQATVYTVLNGFRHFNKWSPWADIDPNATTTVAGAETGVGAKMTWSGNAEVGSGSQEIIEAAPFHRIQVRLGFGDFPGDFTATYLVSPEGSGTRVVWGFDANYGDSLMGRYFGLLSDGMLGPDYEKGLARLKAFVESLPGGDFSQLKFEPTEIAPEPIVLMSVRSANNPSAIGVALGVAYGRIAGYMSTAGLKQAAPPIAIYRGGDADTLSLDAAIPVEQAGPPPAGALRVGQLPAGRAVRTQYVGPYAGLAAVRGQIAAYLAASGLQAAGPVWEQYVSDPAKTPEAELITNIFLPIR